MPKVLPAPAGGMATEGKTDRLDTELLKRAFLGWLRGEPDHCSMAAIPTLEEEDARRPHRERETLVGERTRIVNRMKSALARLGIRGFKPTLRRAPERLDELRMPGGAVLPPNTRAELLRDMARLRFVMGQIQEIEQARIERIKQAPEEGSHPMVRMLARVIGLGLEMIELAWRFLVFQKDSALVKWYRARNEDARGAMRKTMIVALARKLLVALWRFVSVGEMPEGVAVRLLT